CGVYVICAINVRCMQVYTPQTLH
ncbi:hypothetical protein M514_26869, partial [Trichuris suis]